MRTIRRFPRPLLAALAPAALLWACPPATSGPAPCEADADCPDGSFCGAGGVCRAEDACADVSCGPGELCTAGDCHPGGLCGQENRVFPPAVLFVVDRSCSMTNLLGASGVSKWEAAVAALSATSASLDEELLFGLTLFPDTSGNRCEQTDVAVGLGANAAAEIGAVLDEALAPEAVLFPDGPCVTNIDTAMSQAAVLVGGGSLDAQVVLVTDGRQANCNEATGEDDARATIAELLDYGVETVVVGFDRAADAAVLDSFALAGGRPNPEPDVEFYPATEPAALEAVLTDLASDALDCAFRLRAPPPDPAALYVFIDEARTEEFTYEENTRVLTLTGAACDAVNASDDARVDVVFGGCPSQ